MMLFLEIEDGSSIEVQDGQNVAEILGITKYEPPIPVHMAGQVMNAFGLLKKYDFENWQSIPDILVEEEDTVYATEKLHGCLHQDSLIMLTDGTEKRIEDIIRDTKINKVRSYDVSAQVFIERSITGRMQRPNIEGKKWVRLVMENGRQLTLTEDHPVFSNIRGWVDAKDVVENEDIISIFDYLFTEHSAK